MKLKLERISKSFGPHRALADVSLALENVRSLVLIGPSGGGKSTLLRVIAGLQEPDDGSVEIDGRRVPFGEPGGLLQHRRTIGTVFQAFNLFPHFTALRNITLPLEAVHGQSPEQALEVASQILNRFKLGDHAHKKPAELSGGQRQRIAIARAVAVRPRLLLFDEPTSALDPEMTGEVLDVIEELRAEGRDFVLVTHHMGFARRVADEIALLARGRIVEAGPVGQIFDQPQTQECREFLSRVLKY